MCVCLKMAEGCCCGLQANERVLHTLKYKDINSQSERKSNKEPMNTPS